MLSDDSEQWMKISLNAQNVLIASLRHEVEFWKRNYEHEAERSKRWMTRWIKKGTSEDMISDFDKDNVANILAGEGDWFTAQLLRLIAKADLKNRELLRKGFPEEVAVFEAYLEG